MTDEQLLIERIAEVMVQESRDWESAISGARLHKITPAVGKTLAGLSLKWARWQRVPLAYGMGSMLQESRFDPMAENPNLQGNPDRTFAKTDWGIAQVAGSNLLALFDGNEEDAKAHALDPEWAVWFAYREYRANLRWAKPDGPNGPELRFPGSDPFYVAALAYNRGKTGATLVITRKNDVRVVGYRTTVERLGNEVKGRRHAARVMRHASRLRVALQGLSSAIVV